jgi:hypothetical protein
METITDWNGQQLEVRRSRGSGVPYVTSWQHNVIRPGSIEWPEWLVKQVRGYVAQRSWFTDADAAALAAEFGSISKFQSLRSEDAVTWSWFGTLALADEQARARTIQWLYDRLGLGSTASARVNIDQWQRVVHPNALSSPKGPEIDVRIDDPGAALVYVESKWGASLGTGKGAAGGTLDDQIVLRRDSLRKDPALAGDPDRPYLVLGVSDDPPDLAIYDEARNADGLRPVSIAWITWDDLAACDAHPHAEEFARYLAWKREHAPV